jgi:hypothetical protein
MGYSLVKLAAWSNEKQMTRKFLGSSINIDPSDHQEISVDSKN